MASGPGLMERVRLDAAVRAYAPRLRTFIRRRLDDWSEAEDLMQEVLAEWVAAERLMQPLENTLAWLMRVARYRLVDRYRARERESRVLDRTAADTGTAGDTELARLTDEWLAPAADEPESAYARAQLLQELELALEELPEAQRAVFVAHEFEGRSFRDLAAASGEPVNTLLGRKHAAVRALRARLQDWQQALDI